MKENDTLINELRQLRKGSGVQPWKLQHMEVLRKRLAFCLGVDPALLSMSQMHSQLLWELSELGDGDEIEALRHAYAIGHETHPRSLTARRLDFALQIRRHPDTIKAYEDQVIAQLAHRLQNRGTTSVNNASREVAVMDSNVLADTLRRTVAEGLSGLYLLGIHSMEVLQILGRNRFPYLNADIECTLTSSNRGKDWFAYRFSYRFYFTKRTFRLGVVTSLQDSSILTASGLFDEVACVSREDFEGEVATLLESWRFTAILNDGTLCELPFIEISEFDRQQLLEGVWQVDEAGCRVIEIGVPPDIAGATSAYRLETTTHLPVGQCAYWEAPGLMYVNSITFDVRQFPNHQKQEFHLKPFLGVAFSSTLQPHQGRFILPVHGWVTHGHGVMVVWQKN